MMLIAARTAIMAAALRVITVIGMTLSRVRPPVIASPATAHSPRTAPSPTLSGSWYFAARFAVHYVKLTLRVCRCRSRSRVP